MTAALQAAHRLTESRCFDPLKDFVIDVTGLVYYRSRSVEFATHVQRRMDQLHLSDCGSFLRLIQDDTVGARELARLIEMLTIGETYFFRHRELFDSLGQYVLPDLIEKNRSCRRLRIWSAGCSTGPEVYSLAILLRRQFALQTKDWDIRILGTDINREFLARAEQGRFEAWALRALSDDERADYFVKNDDSWVIRPQFREGVSFAYHNLAVAPCLPPGHEPGSLDLILCRNVLIYFSVDLIRRAIAGFHNSLVEGGWLLTGHAEHHSEWFGDFQTHMPDHVVLYRKPEELSQPADTERFGEIPSNRPVRSRPAQLDDDCRLLPEWDLAWSRSTTHPALPLPAAVKSAAAVAEPAVRASDQGDVAADDNSRQAVLRALLDQGQLVEAERICSELLVSNRLEPAPYLYRGLILQQMGDDGAAEQNLRRAVYLDRHYVLAHYHLGLLYQKQHNVKHAGRCFRNVVALLAHQRPGDPLPDGDGMTVADLACLTTAHLSALEEE